MAESKSYPLIVEYRRSTSALQGSTMPRELFVFSIGSPQRERVWEVCRTHSQITPSYNKDSDNTTYLNSFEESLKKRKDPDKMYKFIYTGDESSPNDYVEFSPSIFNGISCKT